MSEETISDPPSLNTMTNVTRSSVEPYDCIETILTTNSARLPPSIGQIVEDVSMQMVTQLMSEAMEVAKAEETVNTPVDLQSDNTNITPVVTSGESNIPEVVAKPDNIETSSIVEHRSELHQKMELKSTVQALGIDDSKIYGVDVTSLATTGIAEAPTHSSKPQLTLGEDTKPDVTPTESNIHAVTPADDTQKEVTSTNTTKPEVTLADDTKPEVSPTEDTKPEVTTADNAKPEVTPTEDTILEVVPTDDTKSDMTPTDDSKLDKTPEIDAKRESASVSSQQNDASDVGPAESSDSGIERVLRGQCHLEHLPALPKKVVRIFVSSTFTGNTSRYLMRQVVTRISYMLSVQSVVYWIS